MDSGRNPDFCRFCGRPLLDDEIKAIKLENWESGGRILSSWKRSDLPEYAHQACVEQSAGGNADA